jgi:hypothetical protein
LLGFLISFQIGGNQFDFHENDSKERLEIYYHHILQGDFKNDFQQSLQSESSENFKFFPEETAYLSPKLAKSLFIILRLICLLNGYSTVIFHSNVYN